MSNGVHHGPVLPNLLETSEERSYSPKGLAAGSTLVSWSKTKLLNPQNKPDKVRIRLGP